MAVVCAGRRVTPLCESRTKMKAGGKEFLQGDRRREGLSEAGLKALQRTSATSGRGEAGRAAEAGGRAERLKRISGAGGFAGRGGARRGLLRRLRFFFQQAVSRRRRNAAPLF